MRTEVRICFDSKSIPGGAQAILGPAGCGPDVATVEDVPVLRQVEVWVTLEASDPRLEVLFQLLKQHGQTFLERRSDIHTDDELAQARLILVQLQTDHEVFGGPRVGTTYDMTDACPVCGAGARQTSPMFIDGEDLRILKKLKATSTYYHDILVEDDLAAQLEALGAIGLSFREVIGVKSNKRHVELPWRQLCATHVLPPVSPRSTGILREDICARCGRSGFFPKIEDPPRLVYRARDLVGAEDVNTTWEWFGDVKFNGDVSKALFPAPWMLVTPKVWRVFRDAGVTSLDWHPIRVDESGG